MVKISDEIKKLMMSSAYQNSNNPQHKETQKQVSEWFNKKYSGSKKDSTGKNVSIRKVWTWHAYNDEKTCADCAALSGQIFEDRSEIPDHPHHPNCRCWIEETEMDDGDNQIEDSKFKNANNKTAENEGGYVDDPKLIDQPTNMGIIQPTLDS